MKRALAFLLLFLGATLFADPLLVEPYQKNGWTKDLNIPAQTELTIQPQELPGLCDLFLNIDALRVQVERRARAHAVWLEIVGEEESIASDASLRFELVRLGRRYAFDKWGNFSIDRRFITQEDNELIARFEAFYQEHYATSPLSKTTAAALQKPQVLTEDSVPIFAGFEDDRYQKHDELILKLVAEFNANRALWAGAEPGVTVNIPKLTPRLVKSLMIEETGGNGPRSREAWEVDPLQVNVPGDWSDVKKELGLKKPKNRNEGTIEQNLRAGIKFLVRKGFGVSGRGVSRRPDAYFDSWRVALQRYNGRRDRISDGRSYKAAYAQRVLRRATSPKVFVPIARDYRSAR